MKKMVDTVLKCVAVGASVGTVVCLLLKSINSDGAIMLLAIGLAALFISTLVE